jgi:curved DNA-binding protein CbpA
MDEELAVVVREVLEGKTFYEVLGVTPEAEAAEIRTAYRRRCLILHPDKVNATAGVETGVTGAASETGGSGADGEGGNETSLGAKERADRAFHLVSLSYDHLSTEEKRLEYDLLLKEGKETGYFTSRGSSSMSTEERRVAALNALASFLNTGSDKKRCLGLGCNIAFVPSPSEPQGDIYCERCRAAERQRRVCSNFGCTNPTSGPQELQCASCRSQTIGKKSKCKTLGCFNSLTPQEEKEGQSICIKCRTKPRKCQQLGCLSMVTPKAGATPTDADKYCDKHRTPASRSVFA